MVYRKKLDFMSDDASAWLPKIWKPKSRNLNFNARNMFSLDIKQPSLDMFSLDIKQPDMQATF